MSKRILVVEDQPDNRQIIRDMLAPIDYEITEAENGEDALAAIAKQRPDLILMDIQLPCCCTKWRLNPFRSDDC
jgi:CheY-like chemotaxis protein